MQADLLVAMYAPVAGQLCEIFPWFDRGQPLLSTLWESWSSQSAIHGKCQWLWMTVPQNSILNAMPFSLRYGCNREGVSADERLPSWNRWLYGDVSVRCWGGFPSQLSSDFSVQWLLVVINGAGQREGTQTIALGLWFLGFISFLHK